jgi:hypothetical protein
MLNLVGYDSKAQILEVVFNTGDHYRYFEVSPDEYDA